MQIRGIIPPVATPMQANEDLDLPRLKWFLDHLIGQGAHGVFVLGTNSEFYALDVRGKQDFAWAAWSHVRTRVPDLAVHDAETMRDTIRRAQMPKQEAAV